MFLLVPVYLGSPGQKDIKRMCVCVCLFPNAQNSHHELTIKFHYQKNNYYQVILENKLLSKIFEDKCQTDCITIFANSTLAMVMYHTRGQSKGQLVQKLE